MTDPILELVIMFQYIEILCSISVEYGNGKVKIFKIFLIKMLVFWREYKYKMSKNFKSEMQIFSFFMRKMAEADMLEGF